MADCSNKQEVSRSGNVKTRTILWCVPRSVSTALAKCLGAGVADSSVWFEPYTYCRVASITASDVLDVSLPAEYRGNEEVYGQVAAALEKMSSSSGTVTVNREHLSYASIKQFLENSTGTHVIVKDLVQSMTRDKFQFIPTGFKHTFLIRHPLRVFSSFRKIAYQHTAHLSMAEGEVGSEERFDIERDYPMFDKSGFYFRSIYEIWKHVRENFDADPIVIDGDDLLAKPAELLPKYCRAVGLPYDEAMLRWGSSKEALQKWILPGEGLIDGVLVYTYGRALESGEFLQASQMPSRDHVTPDVIRYVDQVMPYYEEMYESRLKV